MTGRILDPDVQLLAGIAATLRADYADEDSAWEGSPFAWIKTRPSRQVGAIGEKLVAGWCAAKDLDVTKARHRDADRNIGGLDAEIKFSTLWKSGGYTFQQIRDQTYDIVVFLGLSPSDAHCWVVPKPSVMAMWGRPGGPQPQHGGSRGRDTAWLTFPPNSPPSWLRSHGGRLSEALGVLKSLVSRE